MGVDGAFTGVVAGEDARQIVLEATAKPGQVAGRREDVPGRVVEFTRRHAEPFGGRRHQLEQAPGALAGHGARVVVRLGPRQSRQQIGIQFVLAADLEEELPVGRRRRRLPGPVLERETGFSRRVRRRLLDDLVIDDALDLHQRQGHRPAAFQAQTDPLGPHGPARRLQFPFRHLVAVAVGQNREFGAGRRSAAQQNRGRQGDPEDDAHPSPQPPTARSSSSAGVSEVAASGW